MSGAITMAPAAKPSFPFHRSHSTPDLLSHPPPSSSSSPKPHSALQSLPSIPTLPSLPAFNVQPFDGSIVVDCKSPTVTVSSLPSRSSQAYPDLTVERPSRKRSNSRPHSWTSNTASVIGPGGSLGSPSQAYGHEAGKPSLQTSNEPSARYTDTKNASTRPNTASAGYVDFAKSWMSGSRTQSPGTEAQAEGREVRPGSGHVGGRSWKRRPSSGDFIVNRSTDSLSSTSRAINRASGYLTRIKQGPQSVFGRGGSGAPLTSTSVSAPSAGEHMSDDLRLYTLGEVTALSTVPGGSRRSSKRSTDASSCEDDSRPGSTATAASEHESDTTAETGRANPSAVGDPLRGPFGDLEATYQVFAGKSTTAQRMAVVKTALIPFLRRYAHDPSNRDTEALWPEDIERRTSNLGRWWAALLEILDGNSGRVAWGANTESLFPPSCTPQPLAGVDRPALLEATTLIMVRPEWRMSTTYFRPLAERSPAEKVRVRSDSAGARSLREPDPTILARSAEQHIRAMFISNLLAQMALVVDKMSLRHAPLSLVNFAGKACAYAFFFVPGVADVLVRLWGLEKNIGVITRTVDELGLPRTSQGESEDIVALFPPSMGSLGWTSVRAVREKLRRPAKVPVQAAHIPWHGPWVSRWRGADTDLFFVFCKYFYVISEEFVPHGLPLVEKARAPAFVLVHAQLLTILDNTINRQAAFEAIMRPSLAQAFHGADAELTPVVPLLPNNNSNLLRGIDENCLIVLLKDFLSLDDCLVGPRNAFADAFLCLLKAATKHTGRYDHNSQYLLCDFLQEALVAYDGACGYILAGAGPRRCQSPSEDQLLGLIDWKFWLGVFEMMLSSNNTMSEIRVLSLIFSTWDIITADPARKKALCLDWLLTEEVFAQFFTNWCPMVRAYFMRLLCWRICRDAGSANEADARIFLVVSNRLQTVWSHYLWLKQAAEQTASSPPSTAPSLPQPGKRFMIVRTEIPDPQNGLFVGFDSASGALASGHTPVGVTDPSSGKRVDVSKSTAASRRWSLLGKVFSFNSAAALDDTAASLPSTSAGLGRRDHDEEFDQIRGDVAAARSRNVPTGGQQPPAPPPKKPGTAGTSASSDSDSTSSSAVLDTSRFIFRFTLHNVAWQTGLVAGGIPALPKDRILTRPRLPAPAQARVSARIASTGRRSESPPPPAPGLPPPTRRVSGWAQGGLINEARNAQPLTAAADSGNVGRRDPMRNAELDFIPIGALPFEKTTSDAVGDSSDKMGQLARSKTSELGVVIPVKPVGIYETASRYSGRALTEWSIVVNECNSFVDRRRNEGVFGLSDVEVPALDVEGLRRLT